MYISLDQAIEIHAKVLLYRRGKLAERHASDAAKSCERTGDKDGHDIWLKVAREATRIREEKQKSGGQFVK